MQMINEYNIRYLLAVIALGIYRKKTINIECVETNIMINIK